MGEAKNIYFTCLKSKDPRIESQVLTRTKFHHHVFDRPASGAKAFELGHSSRQEGLPLRLHSGRPLPRLQEGRREGNAGTFHSQSALAMKTRPHEPEMGGLRKFQNRTAGEKCNAKAPTSVSLHNSDE